MGGWPMPVGAWPRAVGGRVRAVMVGVAAWVGRGRNKESVGKCGPSANRKALRSAFSGRAF